MGAPPSATWLRDAMPQPTSSALLFRKTQPIVPAWFQFAQHNCDLRRLAPSGSAVEKQQLLIEVATKTVRHYATVQRSVF
jgi:hypothetical protein